MMTEGPSTHYAKESLKAQVLDQIDWLVERRTKLDAQVELLDELDDYDNTRAARHTERNECDKKIERLQDDLRKLERLFK